MKTTTEMKRREMEQCKLERLKKPAGRGETPLAAAWLAGLDARQHAIGCTVARRRPHRRRP